MDSSQIKNVDMGWGCVSGVELCPSMNEALSLMHSTAVEKKKKRSVVL
jgi:hypothetical protein